MTAKPVRPRGRAERDVEAAIDYYLREAGEGAASGFIDALEAAFGFIASHPGAGSSRYAHQLGLPGLRSHLLAGYPFMVFYLERTGHIDVWRVLHAGRDIPAWMQGLDL